MHCIKPHGLGHHFRVIVQIILVYTVADPKDLLSNLKEGDGSKKDNKDIRKHEIANHSLSQLTDFFYD